MTYDGKQIQCVANFGLHEDPSSHGVDFVRAINRATKTTEPTITVDTFTRMDTLGIGDEVQDF